MCDPKFSTSETVFWTHFCPMRIHCSPRCPCATQKRKWRTLYRLDIQPSCVELRPVVCKRRRKQREREGGGDNAAWVPSVTNPEDASMLCGEHKPFALVINKSHNPSSSRPIIESTCVSIRHVDYLLSFLLLSMYTVLIFLSCDRNICRSH